MDYTPAPLTLVPATATVNGRLPDDVALFYQNANYQKYHELAFDYTLLLKVVKGEQLTDAEQKQLKK